MTGSYDVTAPVPYPGDGMSQAHCAEGVEGYRAALRFLALSTGTSSTG